MSGLVEIAFVGNATYIRFESRLRLLQKFWLKIKTKDWLKSIIFTENVSMNE